MGNFVETYMIYRTGIVKVSILRLTRTLIHTDVYILSFYPGIFLPQPSVFSFSGHNVCWVMFLIYTLWTLAFNSESHV